MEAPDQIIAKRYVSGATVTGDWDIIELDNPESDPVYLASAAANVTNTKIGYWDTAYGRGNHAIM
jgi:hypothetical protein